MFTGIIEEIGKVAAIDELGDSIRLKLQAEKVLEDAQHGDSIAVQGVCLTVAGQDDSSFWADCMMETLNRSNLGELRIGDPVNLERAAALTSRLDGHIVQGHVDGTTSLISKTPSTHWTVLRFGLPEGLEQYIVEKGSIALNGTSLTVSALGADYFEVSLIPVTLEDTVFGSIEVGDRINVEVDIVAKYVERMLGLQAGNLRQAPAPESKGLG